MLAPDEVHVWRVRLTQPRPRLDRFWSTLDDVERGRAARLLRARDRDEFVAAHGALRGILGRYVRAAPAAICLTRAPTGKPAVVGPLDGDGLQFSLSHSGGLALCAVSAGREVGVDVARIRVGVAVDALALRILSAGERGVLSRLPRGTRARAFFTCWSRKEAYLKACGLGLGPGLGDLDVLPLPRRRLPTPGHAGAEAERLWWLRHLDAGPRFAAALAAEGAGWRLVRWQWREWDADQGSDRRAAPHRQADGESEAAVDIRPSRPGEARSHIIV